MVRSNTQNYQIVTIFLSIIFSPPYDTIGHTLFQLAFIGATGLIYRKLLDDFLRSASKFLSPNGEIHVALCQGQGGSDATTLTEWKDSWTPSMFAGEHGLLLFDVSAYEVC